MRFSLGLSIALNVIGAFSYATPPRASRTVHRRDSSQFISTQGNKFFANGSEFKFIGTNAYWLPYLDSDDDINTVLANMSATGIKVVRTWAFNDVTEIPSNGSWLQLIQNGETAVNTGSNGLQKLDKFVELAQNFGIYVYFSLTNNWNPIGNATNPAPLPRNFLSNSYGGMDAYVREFGSSGNHDEFYTNDTIIDIFTNYTKQVITRFVDNPFVFGWELANDPRCISTLPTSSTCDTLTITQWHAEVADFVRSIDSNHLVSSGNQGFQCPSCQKLFPITPTPTPSAAVGKRTPKAVVNKASLIREVSEKRRKAAKARRAAASAEERRSGPSIRGRWKASSTVEKRQSSGAGSAFDGSQGIDSQDILNIPGIGFGTFQFFPDQNDYTTTGDATQGLSGINATIQEGVDWIQSQAAFANAVGKPVALTAFGLVTQNNFPFFVPFNSTIPLANQTNTTTTSTRKRDETQGQTATNEEQQSAYLTWLQAGIDAGVTGLTQYQYSAGGLTQSSSGTDEENQSPNDGYGTQGTSTDQTLEQASEEQQSSSS